MLLLQILQCFAAKFSLISRLYECEGRLINNIFAENFNYLRRDFKNFVFLNF